MTTASATSPLQDKHPSSWQLFVTSAAAVADWAAAATVAAFWHQHLL
jgi:hypothetical protein